MNIDHSLLGFFVNAGPVVKAVMALLLVASLISWTFIFQRWSFLGKIGRSAKQFEKQFANSKNITEFYQKISGKKKQSGLSRVFTAGFKDYLAIREMKHFTHDSMLQSVRSAMLAEQGRLGEVLDAHLSFLATVASTSPYIGLFGTVWGIMTAFTALGSVQQASIAMVAPGISEALIATAMGLFAAIPAAIAYNRFTHRVENIMNRIDIFSEDFVRLLAQQASR